MNRRHSVAALAAAATMIAPLAATTGISSASAAEEESSSPLSVLAPTNQRVQSYGGRVYTDFGMRVAAHGEAFEIWSRRGNYRKTIKSTWRRESGDVALPDDTLETFNGMSGFVRLQVRRATDGKMIRNRLYDGCLNTPSERLSPDAPVRSLYPRGCPPNPYTKGSVMGIQRDWAARLLPEWNTMTLPNGRYDVTMMITRDYARLFGIAPGDRRTTSRVRVVTGTDEWYRGMRAERRAANRSVTRDFQAAASEPTGDSELVPGPRPDLRSLPAFDISINRKKELLRFGANVWNAGDSPLVVDGFRAPDEDHMTAYQYFFDGEGEQVGHQEVGELHFHGANHQHWHFEDFATYRLLDENKTRVRRSGKRSFCLAATDLVNATVPNAEWRPQNTDLETACGDVSSLSIREVLQSGNGDTYHQFRAGQAISVKGLPNGTYYLSVLANPRRALIESDMRNNESLRRIKLGGSPGNRTVWVSKVGRIDESDWSEFY